ncbi:hypothetical protein PVAP13_2NG087146 [Panicum virgatum]|uniref:Uncharacterized protein n=1 Tax=Panicum virgatum TaxID=38727 RepID=A0A8T0VI64_PANVG|nr:hypothetical protein PVAP13_2NG087146 [Panicum virgatum]
MHTNYRLGDCRQKRHTCDAHLILPCVAQQRVNRKGGGEVGGLRDGQRGRSRPPRSPRQSAHPNHAATRAGHARSRLLGAAAPPLACHCRRPSRLHERSSWVALPHALGAACLCCSPSLPLVGCAATCARGRPPPPLAITAARTGYASATRRLRSGPLASAARRRRRSWAALLLALGAAHLHRSPSLPLEPATRAPLVGYAPACARLRRRQAP